MDTCKERHGAFRDQGLRWGTAGVALLVVIAGCLKELEGRSCDCVSPYVCCLATGKCERSVCEQDLVASGPPVKAGTDGGMATPGPRREDAGVLPEDASMPMSSLDPDATANQSGAPDDLGPGPEAPSDDDATPTVLDGVVPDPLLTAFSTGRVPSDVPDCAMNERIPAPDKDEPQSLYLGNERFGWAEWRVGTYGNCRGVQWLRFHLQASIAGPLELRYLVDDGTPTGVGYAWPDGLAGLSDATDTGLSHDGPLLFNSSVICALVARPNLPRSGWPVFGAFIADIPMPHAIVGTLC